MVYILIFYLLCFPFSSIALFTRLPLPPRASGPESFAFDGRGGGPYTGVSDGRILKYQGPKVGFVDYAVDSPNRSKAVCDGNTDPSAFGGICGRPLGLVFRSGELCYIADGVFGLLVAGINGGLARPLVSGAEGQPFKFLNALDIVHSTGTVYAVDTSGRYNISEFEQIVPVNDSTGRLIKYEPNTNITTVLSRNLSGPGGIAVSSDGSFLLFTEYLAKRVQKYWLKGPKANTSEVLVNFEGRPDNIKRTAYGNFWIAVDEQISSTSQTIVPRAIQINQFGQILANFSLSNEYYNTSISEVNEFDGALYIGGNTDFVGVYTIGR